MKKREFAIGWQGAEHLEMMYARIGAEELSGDCFGEALPGLIIDLRHIRRAAGRTTGGTIWTADGKWTAEGALISVDMTSNVW
jgi:hypothetical protein